jgi:hypothetical protein
MRATMPRARRPARIASLVLAFLPGAPAMAQAWLPPQGDLSVSLNYSHTLNKKHFTATGGELDAGHTRTDTLALQASWAPADRWQLVAGLPWVRTQFLGGNHAHGPEVDHGHGNKYLTDLRLELHYQLAQYPVAIAPYIAQVIPVRDYPVLGHAAPGRGLKETWLGVFAGRSFDTLPGSYAQLRYNYAFVEEVVGIHHDHHNLDVELGYFITDNWSVQAIGSWRWALGGIDLPVPPTNPLYLHHDQLGAAEFLNLTAGIAWFASPRYSVYAGYTESVRGKNAHKVDRNFALSIGFRPIPR